VDGPVDELTFGSAPVAQTDDVDEACEVLEQTYLPLRVKPIGGDSLNLRLNAVHLPLVTAGYIHFGGEVALRAPDIRSYHVNIPLSGRAINTWEDGHQEMATASVSAAVFMPDLPVDVAWSQGCGQLCLMISPHEMNLQLEMLLDRPVPAPVNFERHLDLKTTSSASWLQLVTILEREAGRADGMLSHRLAVHNLQHLLIQSLLLVQPHNYTEALNTHARPASPAQVTRAIELMRAHPEAEWTTARLARATRVSARALQKGFSRSNELPPTTYLRHLRLHRVHSDLVDADPRSVTVTAVARRWGFLHLGRFAQQYRQQFGESPSETLQTARINGRSFR
jgi:AraC-like DNA-binding protein